jgi:hypothetical protein
MKRSNKWNCCWKRFCKHHTTITNAKKMRLPLYHHHQSSSSSSTTTFPDFILLAEFCEQRGPVTLLTVPEKRTHFEHFDFDSFARRILSSDHTRKMDPGGCNSGWVSPEDTMIYLRDTSQKAHAYVCVSCSSSDNIISESSIIGTSFNIT